MGFFLSPSLLQHAHTVLRYEQENLRWYTQLMSIPFLEKFAKVSHYPFQIGPVGTEPNEQLTMSLSHSYNAPPTSTPHLRLVDYPYLGLTFEV